MSEEPPLEPLERQTTDQNTLPIADHGLMLPEFPSPSPTVGAENPTQPPESQTTDENTPRPEVLHLNGITLAEPASPSPTIADSDANKSLKAEAKRPQDTVKEDSEKKLSDYVDPWDEVATYMSDSETSIFEPEGTMSAEDEKLFLERFAKISEMYEKNKQNGIPYAETAKVFFKEGVKF